MQMRDGIGDGGLPQGREWQRTSCQCRRRGDAGSIPGSGRSPGGGNGNTLQYSSLKHSMDKRSLVDSLVHGVTESQKRLRERERVDGRFWRKEDRLPLSSEYRASLRKGGGVTLSQRQSCSSSSYEYAQVFASLKKKMTSATLSPAPPPIIVPGRSLLSSS